MERAPDVAEVMKDGIARFARSHKAWSEAEDYHEVWMARVIERVGRDRIRYEVTVNPDNGNWSVRCSLVNGLAALRDRFQAYPFLSLLPFPKGYLGAELFQLTLETPKTADDLYRSLEAVRIEAIHAATSRRVDAQDSKSG